MVNISNSSTDSLLSTYVDKIANAQSSLFELYTEINKLKQDARADKFNMEAIHQLGQIVAKSPHDKGLRLLTDIVRYAQESGIEINTLGNTPSAIPQNQDDDAKDSHSNVSYYVSTNAMLSENASLLVQFSLGIIVSGSLIWLMI